MLWASGRDATQCQPEEERWGHTGAFCRQLAHQLPGTTLAYSKISLAKLLTVHNCTSFLYIIDFFSFAYAKPPPAGSCALASGLPNAALLCNASGSIEVPDQKRITL